MYTYTLTHTHIYEGNECHMAVEGSRGTDTPRAPVAGYLK